METLTEERKSSMTSAIPETGIITFCAYRPRTQMPVTCRPCTDESGQLYTGQGQFGYFESLSPQEKQNLPWVFDYETSVILEDGKTLNLDNPKDKATWKWLQRHPYIDLERTGNGSSREKAFYVANAVKEAKIRIDNSAKVDEARPAVRKLSQADQVRVAKALGLDGAQGFSPEQILDWLLSKANTQPEAVLTTIDPGNKGRVNASIAVKDFIKYKVIERLKDGAFYFGGAEGVNLGHNEDMVVNYLLDPVNSERVKGMKSVFADRSKRTIE
jgi:hypothetical protein